MYLEPRSLQTRRHGRDAVPATRRRGNGTAQNRDDAEPPSHHRRLFHPDPRLSTRPTFAQLAATTPGPRRRRFHGKGRSNDTVGARSRGLSWASSVWLIVLFPVITAVTIWIYAFILVFSALWFGYYCLRALQRMRAEEHGSRNAAPVPY